MSASSYLSYGGVLKVVRTDGSTLNNANAGVGVASTSALKIDNYDDYTNNHSDGTNFTFSAKNPGSWANNLKVCFIDNLADQIIGIATPPIWINGCKLDMVLRLHSQMIVLPGTGTTSTLSMDI
jgi:hypothetical protein